MSWLYTYHLSGNPAAGGIGLYGRYRETHPLGIVATRKEARDVARIRMRQGSYIRIVVHAMPHSDLDVRAGKAKAYHKVETYERCPRTGLWWVTDGKGKQHRIHLDPPLPRGKQTTIFDLIKED
jgi:hypothetical protein